ncbi:MAG: tetratricopeptide repeat protein [Myxococcales bacterium]|nr:tetratricopeptide repeat protein [Myxococcales bacterium]
MNRATNPWKSERGALRPGLAIFVALLIAAAVMLSYRYMTRATRLNNEAVEQMGLGDYEKALEILDQAQILDPDNREVLINRGIALAERHRFDEALQSFERAAQIAPDDPLPLFNRGYVLHSLRRYEEALEPLRKAVGLKPDHAEAWLLIGECEFERFLAQYLADKTAAKPEPAREAYRTYLRLKPDGRDRRKVEQKLDILAKPEEFPSALDRRRPPEEPAPPPR